MEGIQVRKEAKGRDTSRPHLYKSCLVGRLQGAFAAASFHWCWAPGAPRSDLAAPRVASAGEWGGERTLAPQMNLVVSAVVAPEEGLRARAGEHTLFGVSVRPLLPALLSSA